MINKDRNDFKNCLSKSYLKSDYHLKEVQVV